MANQDIKVTFAADSGPLLAGIRSVIDGVKAAANGIASMGAQCDQADAAIDRLSVSLAQAGNAGKAIAARANAQALGSVLDNLKREIEARTTTDAQKAALLQQYDRLVEASLEQGSAAYQAAKNFEVKVAQQAEQQKLQEVQQSAAKQIKAITDQETAVQRSVAAQVALKEISAGDAVAATVTGLAREHDALDAALRQESELLKQRPDMQRAVLKKLADADDSYNKQILANAEKTIQAEQKAWDQYAAPVVGAFNKSLTGMIEGTQSFRQAVASTARSVADDFISSGVKQATGWISNQLMMTTETEAQTAARRLIQTVADNGSAASVQAAVAAYTQAEAGKTAAAQAGAAERTAADSTANEGVLARIFDQLARSLGLESGKTAASTAGIAQRSAADTAVNSLEAIQALGQIEMAAAVASANAYAAYAELPPVALAAAAEAWATTMGFASGLGGGLASAAGGWGRVPADGMLAELHRNEMVLPSPLADTIRGLGAANGNQPGYGMPALPNAAVAARGAVAGGGTGSGDVHVHLNPSFNVNSLDARSAAQVIIDNKEAVMQAVGHGVRNGAHLGISSLRRR